MVLGTSRQNLALTASASLCVKVKDAVALVPAALGDAKTLPPPPVMMSSESDAPVHVAELAMILTFTCVPNPYPVNVYVTAWFFATLAPATLLMTEPAMFT